MNINEYCHIEDSRLSFSREQASKFAKKVAGDFNPIHDADSKRFCVPGDLLFTAVLHHYGVRQRMIFNFSGMVNDDTQLILPDCDKEHMALLDDREKKYLAIECNGNSSDDADLIHALTSRYVEFSSRAFPEILEPLMKEHDVMINPQRPLIIYESMSFELDTFEINNLHLELHGQKLQVNGKRGDVTIDYDLMDGDKVVGRGCKRMVLSALRQYDKTAMDALVAGYTERREAFKG